MSDRSTQRSSCPPQGRRGRASSSDALLVVGDSGPLREVLDAHPVAMCLLDPCGIVLWCNAAAELAWGRQPDFGHTPLDRLWSLSGPDGRDMALDEALAAIDPVNGGRPPLEVTARRADGTTGPMLILPSSPVAMEDRGGGTMVMFTEAADRSHANSYTEQLISLVELSEDGILCTDHDGIITSWNNGAADLFGYTAAEAVGMPVAMLLRPEHGVDDSAAMRAIRSGERVKHFETVRVRKDGSLIDVSVSVSPVKNARGEITGAAKICRDITELKQTRERQTLLVGEIKHRIKNILSTVQAIARQTMHSASLEERRSFVDRLMALGAAQDLLTEDQMNRARLDELVDRVMEPFRDRHRTRLVISGEGSVFISAQKSGLLSMALHELATNAVKYGALSNRHGQVRISWHCLEDDRGRVRLTWTETDGPPVSPPRTRGFGSRLIQRALDDGNDTAELRFDPEGVSCVMELAHC